MVEAAILFPILLGISLAVIEFGFIFMREMTVKNYTSQIVQKIERGETDIEGVVTALRGDPLLRTQNVRVCARSYITNIAPACTTDDRVLQGIRGSRAIVNIMRDFTPLTPAGNLLGFILPKELSRQETVVVGLKSGPVLDDCVWYDGNDSRVIKAVPGQNAIQMRMCPEGRVMAGYEVLLTNQGLYCCKIALK